MHPTWCITSEVGSHLASISENPNLIILNYEPASGALNHVRFRAAMHPTWCMAERVGFEPTVPLLAGHTISSRAPSASSVISPGVRLWRTTINLQLETINYQPLFKEFRNQIKSFSIKIILMNFEALCAKRICLWMF